MPVVSLDDGNQVGKVKSLLLDAAGKRVAGLVLEQRGVLKDIRVIPFEQIISLGEHAITVDKSSRAERPVNLPHLAKLIKEQINLIGTQAITEEGTSLGKVEDYHFDGNTGRITLLVLRGSKPLDSLFTVKAGLPASALITIGKRAVIARRGAEDLLEKQTGTMQETMNSAKETSAKVWDATVKTSKKLGKKFQKSLERFSPEKEKPRQIEQPADANKKMEATQDELPERSVKVAEETQDELPERPATPVAEPAKEPERGKAN
jgi:uncharacterized protein YrrD